MNRTLFFKLASLATVLFMLLGMSTNALADTQAITLKNADMNTEWDDSATFVTLNGATASVSGAGAAADGGVISLSKKGTYVFSGTLDNGQIVVNAPDTDKVRIVLNGAHITNLTGAAIDEITSDKLIITLAEGTENSVTDGGANYAYRDTAREEPNAAVYAKDDLTINGLGNLTVNAGFHNGIATKDDLLIVSGTLNVNAKNHALRGKDSVSIADGVINLTAGADGIQTDQADNTQKGFVIIENGIVNITASRDGIQADHALTVLGGTVNIQSGDSGSQSQKGLKSGGILTISGGTLNIDALDDALHAVGNAVITDGVLNLISQDDGIHADADLIISGGQVTVSESYEGFEAANIIISGGIVRLTSQNDGINAAGGADQSGMDGRFERDPSGSGSYSVMISGGDIVLYANGDGIDSNGPITISGGQLIAIINSSPDNGALDTDDLLTLSGGTVIYGGTGLGSAPKGDSLQSYVFTDASPAAGSNVTVKKDGQTLAAFTLEQGAAYLAVSTPDIQAGQTYEIYAGDSLLATAEAGTGGVGIGFGGGRRGK